MKAISPSIAGGAPGHTEHSLVLRPMDDAAAGVHPDLGLSLSGARGVAVVEEVRIRSYRIVYSIV